jgi:hypothetical protein
MSEMQHLPSTHDLSCASLTRYAGCPGEGRTRMSVHGTNFMSTTTIAGPGFTRTTTTIVDQRAFERTCDKHRHQSRCDDKRDNKCDDRRDNKCDDGRDINIYLQGRRWNLASLFHRLWG